MALGWVLWSRGGAQAHRSSQGVVVACVNRKWGICHWLQQEEGVRAGPLPGRHTFSLPVLRGSLGGGGRGVRKEGESIYFPLLVWLLASPGVAGPVWFWGWLNQGGTFFRAG